VVTKPLAGATTPADEDPRPDSLGLTGDIRQTRLFPSVSQLRSLVRRVASIVALVAIDVGGLAVALYLALVLRELYYGTRPILWGLPWSAEAKWLPFLALVTVLVFWRGGLYAQREQRAGAGRVVSSLLLVTVITLAFAVGTGYPHTTFGLYLTAFVLSVVVITGLRAAYELVTRDVWRLAGVRRRAVLLGSGERLDDLRRALGQGRGGIDYDFLGAVTNDGTGLVLPVLGSLLDLPSVLEQLHPDELIVSGVMFATRTCSISLSTRTEPA
jgi:FlaA1/EpsC-like NDP-sugar epimerase